MTDPRRSLPAVDRLLESAAFGALLELHPRERVVTSLRASLDQVRRGRAPLPVDGGEAGEWAARTADVLAERDRPTLLRVINATGVILHTNLGRAPLAAAAVEAMADAGRGYVTLEYDAEEGRRGSRHVHGVEALRELTGAEDALAVNNCAAALLLALDTLARGRGVAVSRGELVEIGGSFRIPEIMACSGARLVEVGATNRTRLADYRRAVEEEGAVAILKVHRSNFRLSGFTEEVELEALAELAGEVDVALIHDLGSGMLGDARALGLPDEPTPRRSVEAGADVVLFSGDKLLGGPQAGLAVGRTSTIAAMRSNPMCRALRLDKMTLAGLAATLRLHLDPALAARDVPAWARLAETVGSVERRARALASALASHGIEARAAESPAAVGGGTFPEVDVPSWSVVLATPEPDGLARRLRTGKPGIVGRIEAGSVVLDLRTVLPGEEDEVERGVVAAWTPARGDG